MFKLPINESDESRVWLQTELDDTMSYYQLINQYYNKIRETNKPSIKRWTILKRRFYNAEKPSGLLKKVTAKWLRI